MFKKKCKQRKVISKVLIMVMVLANLTFLHGNAFAEENAQNSKLAPLNSDFLEYSKETETTAQPGYGRKGLIPRTVDIPKAAGIQKKTAVALPACYDLRATGKLSTIHDQGASGSCWAFAVYGSLESCLLPSEPRDFSENNLKNNSGFDIGPNDGGNDTMAMAYLARWEGPVDESDDPYNDYSTSSPKGLPAQKHMQNMLIIPNREGPQDNNLIKQAIMQYGAVSSSMYALETNQEFDAYYDASNYSFYYNGYVSRSNHAIDIVGWDDNFDRNKFKFKPVKNGAFIVRNSWGIGFGENGYFYISYEDKFIGTDNAVYYGAESAANYSHVYQYDPLGWIANYGEAETEWAANVFEASSDEKLSAVSFYTISPNTAYEVRIYDTVNGASFSGEKYTSSGTFELPGYHTLKLDTKVSLVPGKKFAVAVKFSSPGYRHPIPVEVPERGISSRASAGTGQSYVSLDGSSWWDLISDMPGTNACIKAFTIPEGPIQGDVDNNGFVNSADALLVLQHDSGMATLTEQQKTGADVDRNGTVDIKDALLILKYSIGLINNF